MSATKKAKQDHEYMCRYVQYTASSIVYLVSEEHSLYGSSRLGLSTRKDTLYKNTVQSTTYTYVFRQLGMKQYELSNHLGNVLSTVTDQKKPNSTGGITIDNFDPVIVSVSDYYPFGSIMPTRSYTTKDYRYGFNGKEKDDEGMGGGKSTYDYGFRIYNSSLGKFLSIDPLTKSYPWYSTYQFAGNTPVAAVDLDGLEEFIVIMKPHPTIPELQVVTIYKVATQSRIQDATAGSTLGTGGVEYRTIDAAGNVTTERVADFKPNTGENDYMNSPRTYYTDQSCAGTPINGTNREAMVPCILDADRRVISGVGSTNENGTSNSEGCKFIKTNIRLTNVNLYSMEISILFKTDKTKVLSGEVENLPDALAKIQKVIDLVNSNTFLQNKTIKVVGGFDIRPSNYNGGSDGGKTGNQGLSEDRAKNVAKKIQDGIPDSNIESEGATTNTSSTVNNSDRNVKIYIIPND